MKSEREKLEKELHGLVQKHYPEEPFDMALNAGQVRVLVDFILNDRRRILAPIVEIHKGEFTLTDLNSATIETLKLSGLLEEK